MKWLFFGASEPLSDENIIKRWGKVKTQSDYVAFVEEARALGTALASNVIRDFFVNTYDLGKEKETPVYLGVDEFVKDPEAFNRMFMTAVSALKTMPEGAQRIREVLEFEDQYYNRLEEIAYLRDVELPKFKTHEGDVIEALLERGVNGDVLAFHELGFCVGGKYPDEVTVALEKTDNNHVVLSLYEVANAQYVSKVGIDKHKVIALGGLLSVLDKVETGEFVNVDVGHVKSIIDDVCKVMLHTHSMLEDLNGARGESVLCDDDGSIDRLRRMFACVEDKLGYEDQRYTKLFDYTVEYFDRTLEEKQELEAMHWGTFPEAEPA